MIEQTPLTYDDLVARYGKDLAFDFLLTIEKLAGIQSEIISMDEENRLQRALVALDDTSAVA